MEEEKRVCFICQTDVLRNGKQNRVVYDTCGHTEHLFCHDNKRNSESAGCIRCARRGAHEAPDSEPFVLGVFSDKESPLLNGAWDSWSLKRANGVVERLDTRIDSGPVGSSEPVEYLPVPTSALANTAHVSDRSRNAQYTHASVREETLQRFLELCDGRASAEELKAEGYSYADIKKLLVTTTTGTILFKNLRTMGITPAEAVDLGATWADLLECGLTYRNIRELLGSVDVYTAAPLCVTYKDIMRDLCNHTWKHFFAIGYSAKELRKLGFSPAEAIDPENGLRLKEFAYMRPMGIKNMVVTWGFTSEFIVRLRDMRPLEVAEISNPESIPVFKYYFCLQIMKWDKADCLKHLKYSFATESKRK